MACKGCGKDDIAKIAAASAEIALIPVRNERIAAFAQEAQGMPEQESRPEVRRQPCPVCGVIIEQEWARMRFDGPKRYCDDCLAAKMANGYDPARSRIGGNPNGQ
jgi:hypothetical protein